MYTPKPDMENPATQRLPLLFFLPLVLGMSGLLTTGCRPQPPPEISATTKAEAAALVSEAQFALQIREYARAEELMRRTLKLRDDLPEYWVTLGMAAKQAGHASEARPAYEKALTIHRQRYQETKRPEELGQEAWVLALLGRREEALQVLATGRKAHPDNEALRKLADPRGLARTFDTPEFKAMAF